MASDMFVRRLVFNRLKKPIRCLNEDGSFIELMPMGDVPLPKYERGICYITSVEEYEKMKNTARGALDFVHPMDGAAIGRANTKFYYLESFEETARESHNKLRITPSSDTSYKIKDPNSEIHRMLGI